MPHYKSVANSIGLTAIIFIALLLIFRNNLFYSETLFYVSGERNDFFVGYNDENGNYVPTDDAIISVDNGYNEINTVRVQLHGNLSQAAKVELYLDDEYGYNLIDTKTIRSNCNEINFYFSKRYVSSVIIQITSEETGVKLTLPEITIKTSLRFFNPIQKRIKWVLKIFILFVVSLIAVFLVKQGRKYESGKNSKQRQSNFELMRIICMFLIILHHYAVHGGLLGLPTDSTGYKVGLLLLPLGKICFDAFIALSMWFMVDVRVAKFERFLKMWMQVFFYSVVFTIIAYLYGANITGVDFLGSLFVMFGNSHGFAASYMIFLLLLPFIIKTTQNITKEQARYLLLIVFMIQVGSQILGAFIQYTQPLSSEIILFILCYVISLNIKKWPINDLFSDVSCIACIAITFFSVYITYNLGYNGIHTQCIDFLFRVLGDESSLLYIASGYSVLHFARKINVPYNRLINLIATSTFGILLIHDHNFFRTIFWKEIIRTQVHFDSEHTFIRVIIYSFGIFISCSVLDYLRQILLEKAVLNCDLFKKISTKVNGVYYEK